jgi:hypothetical protein
MMYLHIALCEHCGREFRHRSKNLTGRKYCSPTCRKAGAKQKRATNAMMWREFAGRGA